MHLMCDIGADARRDVRPQLRRADRESGVGAAIDRHRSARRGTVRGSRVRRETGQRLLNRLELGQRFSELYALVGIVDGQGERRIQRTCHGHGSSQRGEIEQRLRVSRNRDCRCSLEAQRIAWLARWADSLLDDRIGNMQRKTRSEEHTSELQSLMRISYAVFCLKKK